MHTRMLHARFPATGQRIRVVLIDGEPWFAVADLCRILGRTDPTKATKLLSEDEFRVVESPDRTGVHHGNPNLDVVSESGLHRLITRSDKAAARPFQDWVTRELLPSLRRGVPPVPETDPVATFELLGQTFQLYADGSVHCPHGAMDSTFPTPDEDDGPPYGPRFRCTRVERAAIFGGKAIRRCPPVRLTDLARVCRKPPARARLPLVVIAGEAADVLAVLNGVRA